MSVRPDILRVGFGWQDAKIRWISHFLRVGVATQIDVRVAFLGSPGVGEVFFAGGGVEPFLFLGEAPIFPFGVGEGAEVIDIEHGGVAGDDLALITLFLSRPVYHVIPIPGDELFCGLPVMGSILGQKFG